MSSGTLRQLGLRAIKNASPAAALASPRRTIPSLTSNLASCSSFKGRIGAAPLQLRCFHPTPATRLYIPNEVVVATCLGLTGVGVLFARFLLKRVGIVITRVGPGHWPGTWSVIPPISWAKACDGKTYKDVKTIVTAGFEMASRKPTRLRDQAYREASFQVAHEIARLSPEAPRFKVEEMPPLTCLRETLLRLRRTGIHLQSPFDMEKDARIFLYFPNDSPKATVAFLAINSEFGTPSKKHMVATEQQQRLINVALNLWVVQHGYWVDGHHDIIRRIGPAKLPVIISFRGWTYGIMYDTRRKCLVPNSDPASAMLNLIEKNR